MGSKSKANRSLLHFSILFLVIGLASSSYISNEAFEAKQSVGRRALLMQQLTECRVDLEQLNYAVITSQCKRPNYSRDGCCKPLKQLMCPIKDQINDLKTNCANNFFSYVNLYGKYPRGLFFDLCVEGKQGLDCTGFDHADDMRTARG